MRNLHIVFTMNPSGDGLRERASTSPALFNRCVLNWFGDWTDSALYQVIIFQFLHNYTYLSLFFSGYIQRNERFTIK